MDPTRQGVSFTSKATRVGKNQNGYDVPELARLYAAIETHFRTQINSVEEAEEAFSSFLTSYISLRDQLGCVIDENKQLKAQVEAFTIEKEGSPVEIQKQKTKRYKSKVQQLEEQITQLQQIVEDAKNQAREQKVLYQNAERQKSKLETEVQCLKNKLAVHLESENAAPNFENTVQILEGLLAAQTEEITSISAQRDALILKLKVLDDALQKSDECIKDINKSNDEFCNYKQEAEKKLIKAKNEIPELAREVDEMIDDEIRQKVASNGESSPKTFIIDVIKAYMDSISAKEEEDKDEIKPLSESTDKYIEILNRLEDEMRFILTYNSPVNENSSAVKFISDKDIKQAVLTRCAHLGKFLDENLMNLKAELFEKGSMFDPETFKDTEKRLDAFLAYVEEHCLERPPIREIYVLFCAVTEVNYLMSTRISEMARKVKESEDLKYHNDQLRTLQREVAELRQINEESTKKLEAVTNAISTITNSEENNMSDIGKCVTDIMRIFIETKKANEELKTKIDEVTQELDETKEKLLAENAQLSADLEALKLAIADEKKNHELDHHNLVLDIEKAHNEVEEMKRITKAAQEELQQALEERARKVKKMSKTNTETQNAMEELQDQLDKMKADNTALVKTTDELRATIQKQTDRMTAMAKTECKLRASREELKGRIQDIETKLNGQINSLRQQIDDINSENTTIVEDLKNDIEIQKEIVQSTNETLDEVRRQKKNLVDAITKLRISERALKMKITSIQDNYKLEKSAIEARENTFILSLKTQAGKQISDLSAQIQEARRIISAILQENCQIQVPEEASFPSVLSIFEEHFHLTTKDRRVLADAMHLRHILKLDNNIAVSDAYNNLKADLEAATQHATEQETEIERLNKNIRELKGANDSLETQAVTVLEWENWARSIYYQVAEGASPSIAAAELKNNLLEIVLSNLRQRTATRKLETLRSEKQILLDRDFLTIATRKADKVSSIRPLLVALVFTRRIHVMMSSNAENEVCLTQSPSSSAAESIISNIVSNN